MKFVYQYRTPDNKQHRGVIRAASKEAAYTSLKTQGIKPGRVEEAPGFFNKLFGKGKRWIAICVLSAACVALTFAFLGKTRTSAAPVISEALDSTTRRQPIGDAAIIEQGVRSGWADVFELEGERFLASFAVPGVPAGQRNTTEEEIRKALDSNARDASPTSLESEGIEARQIRAMVEGMKHELREFLADGGTVVEYGKLLVQRQEQEIGYYNRAKNELDSAQKAGMTESALMELWANRNGKLRRMGIKLVPIPE